MKTAYIIQSKLTKGKLVALAKEIPGAWIGLKIAAILLFLEGQRPSWISDVLGLTRMSLNRWMRAVDKGGIEAIRPKQKTGRPARLFPKIAEQVKEHMEQSPQKFGLNRVRWDGPTMAAHLQRQFGIKLKVRQAQYWMHKLGYRLKRANHVYLQAKAQDAKRFYRALKKT